MENNQQDSFLQMHLDYDGGNILRETVRWSRFLSIVGIIGLSLCLLGLLLVGSAMLAAFSKLLPGLEGLESLGAALVILCALAFFGISGFLVFMLYRFSTLTRKGIEQQDQVAFAEGMKSLKLYFLISGIFAILGLIGNVLSLSKLF